MSEDEWSSFHDDLVRPVEKKEQASRVKVLSQPPSYRTAGVEWDGKSGELRTGPMDEAPNNWEDLLVHWGLDPSEVEISGPVRRSSWEVLFDGETRTLNAFRAQIVKKTTDFHLDTEKLLEDIRKHKPSKKVPEKGNNAFVVCAGDTQLGKEGTEATINRFLASLTSGPQRLKELRAAGRSIGPVFLPWLGDCLASETEIVTKRHGVARIGSLVGQSVEVKDANGGWVEVEIKSYGPKPLMEVVWRSRRAWKTVRVSKGHEWILRDGRRMRTEHLERGMSTLKGYRRRGTSVGLSQAGVQAGFVYGDGTATSNGCRAIFCGSKDEALLPWFAGVEVSKPDAKGQRHTGARFPESWKNLPDLTEGTSYLHGWLAGYFAADGCVDSRGGVKLSCADRDSLEHVRSICAILGIDSYPIREVTSRAVGRYNDGDLYEISLSLRSLADEFFIIPAHRDRAIMLKGRDSKPSSWVVDSVRDLGLTEETFCVVVPTTHSFLLADGLLTSNCVEGVQGHYPNQTSTVELTMTEQIRVLRRLAWQQIKTYAPLTDRLVVPVVPGNHDEPVRVGGKQITHQSDSFANDMASYLYDLVSENKSAYGHVEIVVPERNSLVVTLDVCGTTVAMAHGHQFNSGSDGPMRWWAGQAHGVQPAGTAKILLGAHKHHLVVRQEGVKTFIQVPALDSGSQWWTNRTGQDSPPGLVSLVVGQDGWRDLAVL